jgi:hypothetical protein
LERQEKPLKRLGEPGLLPDAGMNPNAGMTPGADEKDSPKLPKVPNISPEQGIFSGFDPISLLLPDI